MMRASVPVCCVRVCIATLRNAPAARSNANILRTIFGSARRIYKEYTWNSWKGNGIFGDYAGRHIAEYTMPS